MPKWFEKILKYNHGEKSFKAPFAIYLDLECLLLKAHSCQNNPEKSYTEKKLRINLQAGQYIQNVHLMQQKVKSIITEE